MNENVPNGLSQLHVKQSDITARHFNGLGSSNSSRDTSPSARIQNIPSSQLPPARTGIPTSQLPPSRLQTTSIQQLTKNYGNLNVSGLTTTNLTPFSSPKIQAFSTSTPVIENKEREVPVKAGDGTATNITKNILPSVPLTTAVITETENNEQITKTFTHSATSQFTNVASNALIDNSNKESSISNKDVKSDENSQRNFDSNLFTAVTSIGPIINVKSIEHQSSHANERNMRSIFTHSQSVPSAQNITTQTRPSEQLQASQQNYQSTGVNRDQKVPFQQQFSQINNNQTTNFLNLTKNVQPNQNQFDAMNRTMQTQPRLNTPNQAGINYQQFNAINRTMQNQPRPIMPNVPLQPVSMQYQQRQMPQNITHYSNTQNYGPAANVQQPTLPTYAPIQASPQISAQNVTMQPNQNLSPQVNQNLLPQINQNASQNQSKAHLHSNRYPVNSPQSPLNFQQQQIQQPPAPTQYINQQQPQPHFVNQQKAPQYVDQQAVEYPNNQQFQYANTQQMQMQQNVGLQQQIMPNVTQHGFNKLWGRENFDLLQTPNILPQTKIEAPKVILGQEFLDSVNCNPDIFRCTITKIPETTSLLQKSRLPLGVLIHPFKDLNHLPVIQCNTIVRCRACRTYINPFVFFADSKRWKCNLCYRINDLPDEFQFDPVTKTYGDPSRRPEVKSSTIEYIAPAEYMLRPPQPAVYLFLLDVSRLAVETGYLHTVCNILSSELTSLPGDARTQIGFLAYDSALHFYSLSEGQNQPHEMTVLDIDDIFLPCPDNLLVNLQDRMEMIGDLLTQLPTRYLNSYDGNSALGAALQVGYKMMSATGGRITVFQASLPNIGPGALTPREDPNQRAASNVAHMNPANDFYKRLALECSGQQIAVDLFILNSQYVDIATISGISRFSGGCIHHFPLFKASRTLQNDALERTFRRYITRKIGFEAVMRIRCTRGLSIHTFHGNFFVRSTDLLSLPNINPDAGFGMQVSIEENLTDVQTVCFQAALLYTSSKGERRIRVHTVCLPVANNLTDIINAADEQCIIGLLSKMAVDRSMQSSLSDAREAFINVAIDILSSYKLSLNMGAGVVGLMAPECLKLLPLYISALLKNIAFRIGISTRLDDRVKAMCDMKTKPLPYLIQMIYPDLYPIHNLQECNVIVTEDDETIHQPPRVQLTARSLDSNGAYLLDTGEHMMIFVCANVSATFLNDVLDVPDFGSLSDDYYELPLLENQHSKRVHSFVNFLNDEKSFQATIQVIRENSPNRVLFYERLIEDRLENSLSYHEFLQHIKTQVK